MGAHRFHHSNRYGGGSDRPCHNTLNNYRYGYANFRHGYRSVPNRPKTRRRRYGRGLQGDAPDAGSRGCTEDAAYERNQNRFQRRTLCAGGACRVRPATPQYCGGIRRCRYRRKSFHRDGVRGRSTLHYVLRIAPCVWKMPSDMPFRLRTRLRRRTPPASCIAILNRGTS